MEVVLINPPSEGIDDDHLEPQLGLLYIAAVLRENNISVQIYEMTGCKNEEQIKEKIINIPEGDIYGFTVYCTNYKFVKRCITFIRERSLYSSIILGGPNATALPEFTLKDSNCDFVITGEGEDAFLHIYKGIESGLYISPIVEGWGRSNLDDYPFPAWDLINLNSFNRVLDGERVISIISSRGCKYNCTHCNSVIMGGGSRGEKKVRYRSPENVVKEIKYLQSLGFKKFRFNDDIFTANPNLKEFLTKIKGLNIEYRIFARIEQLDDDTCKLLSESGCKHIAIGLESLNPNNLRFLHKHSQVGLEEENLNNVKKYGMMSRVYFIVGLPYDTEETIRIYFTEASKLPFDEFSVYPLIPYPGTKIWKTPEKFGYTIIDKDFTQYYQIGENKRTCFVLNHKNFNHEDVKRWIEQVYKLFENKIHQGNSKIAR